MIDHSKHLIFIHIARTGGTSVETALTGNDWWQTDPETKHLSALQARKHYGELIWSRYKKFSIVRNPWDRVVSMWATNQWHTKAEVQLPNANEDLKRFIQHLKPHAHEKYNSLFYHEILDEKIDFVLRFENLAKDFSAMLTSLGFEDMPLPHVENRERKPYQEYYYDDETREMISFLFKKDIQDFNYKF